MELTHSATSNLPEALSTIATLSSRTHSPISSSTQTTSFFGEVPVEVATPYLTSPPTATIVVDQTPEIDFSSTPYIVSNFSTGPVSFEVTSPSSLDFSDEMTNSSQLTSTPTQQGSFEVTTSSLSTTMPTGQVPVEVTIGNT